MSTGETNSGPSGLAKGFLGAALVAVAGFVGTAAMSVLSAPKDSVAYDLVQSMTGMLKGPPPAPAAEPPAKVAAAPAPQTLSAMPKAPEPAASPETAPPPKPPSPVASPPAPAVTQPAPTAAAPSPDAAPAATMADRLRQTTALADTARSATAALAATRVLSLNDRAEAPICGATYRLEVTSVAAGRGEVALRSAGQGAPPVTLAVGKPQDVRAGCRVELLGAMDDYANRRAQLRETLIR